MVIDLRSEGSPTYCTTSVFGSNGGRLIASYLYLYFEESYWNGSAFYWIQRWKASCFIFVFVFVFLRSPKVDGQLLHICICIFEKSKCGWLVASYLFLYFWEVSLHSIGSEGRRPVVATFFPDNHHRRLRLQLGAPNNRSAIFYLSFGLCLKYLVRGLLHSGRQDY